MGKSPTKKKRQSEEAGSDEKKGRAATAIPRPVHSLVRLLSRSPLLPALRPAVPFSPSTMNPALLSRPAIAVNLFCMSSRKMAGSSPSSREAKRSSPAVKEPAPPAAPLTELPVKPHRPMSAYAMYAVQRHEQLKQEKPTTRWTETMRLASAEWKTVDDSIRQRLEGQRKVAGEKYKEQMKLYKDQLKQTVVLGDVVRLLHQSKKKSDADSSSKRRLTGYNVFVREKTAGKAGTANMKALSTEWSSLSEWEKKRYNDQAALLSSSQS